MFSLIKRTQPTTALTLPTYVIAKQSAIKLEDYPIDTDKLSDLSAEFPHSLSRHENDVRSFLDAPIAKPPLEQQEDANYNYLYKILQETQYKQLVAKLKYGWFVSTQIIYKFKYHAIVRQTSDDDDSAIYIGDKEDKLFPYYTGDIPDSVLARCNIANTYGAFDTFYTTDNHLGLYKCNGIGDRIDYFTIHSNMPLPTETINLQQVDPILIGWFSCPYIYLDKKGRSVTHIGDEDINVFGIVLGIWDIEKEIELR
jgi:hypothetical protein